MTPHLLKDALRATTIRRAASTASQQPNTARGGLPASAATMHMVSEILAGLKEDGRRAILQFVPACCHSMKDQVAQDFARAAVANLGRVLILTPWLRRQDDDGNESELGASRLARLLGCRSDATTPDSHTAGLYHRRLRDEHFNADPAFSDDRQEEGGQEEGASRFKLTVAICPPPAVSFAALRMAKHCSGSVIIVAAGKTRRNEVEAASRQIATAGGNVLGAVLCDAPSIWSSIRRTSLQ